MLTLETSFHPFKSQGRCHSPAPIFGLKRPLLPICKPTWRVRNRALYANVLDQFSVQPNGEISITSRKRQKLAFISMGFLSFANAAREQFQTAVVWFNTISALLSVIGEGVCSTNRIRMIESISGLSCSSISFDAFSSSGLVLAACDFSVVFTS